MKLNRLRRGFLWQGNKEGGGCNLEKWEVTQLSKNQGGLSIRNLKLHNQCLIMKWLWRFNVEASLWKEVISYKYDQESHRVTNKVNSTSGVGVWRESSPKLHRHTRIRVGNGHITLFWKDHWISQSTFLKSFPDLMLLSSNTEATVGECRSPQGWNLTFKKHFNNWEVDRVENMLKSSLADPDSLRWKHIEDDILTVNRLYKKENNSYILGKSQSYGSSYERFRFLLK